MSDYPVSAAVFLIVLSLGALASTFLLLSGSSFTIDPAAVLVWSLLGILNESFSVHHRRGNIYISTLEAVFFAAYLSGGPVTALVCIAASLLLSFRIEEGGFRHLFNTHFRLTLFNVSHFIVGLYAVDKVYGLLINLTGGMYILPAIGAAPFLFLISCVLNALFYRLEEGRDFLHYLSQVFKPFYADALTAAFAAVIIALTYPRFGIFSAVFFITPILMARLTFKEKAA